MSKGFGNATTFKVHGFSDMIQWNKSVWGKCVTPSGVGLEFSGLFKKDRVKVQKSVLIIVLVHGKCECWSPVPGVGGPYREPARWSRPSSAPLHGMEGVGAWRSPEAPPPCGVKGGGGARMSHARRLVQALRGRASCASLVNASSDRQVSQPFKCS